LESGSDLAGLTNIEMLERVRRGQTNDVPETTSRTLSQIVRANVLTPFNALLGMLLVVILVVGPIQDACSGVLVANALVGIVQELRAKRTLDRLAVLTAPRARAVQDGEVREIPIGDVVLDDVLEASMGWARSPTGCSPIPRRDTSSASSRRRRPPLAPCASMGRPGLA